MSKKIICIILIICSLAVSNAAFFQIKKADAVAPVGVVADAEREMGLAQYSMWDRISVYVWKAAIYPLVRKAIITMITGGDFKITWDSVRTWLIEDLAFQTLHAVLMTYTGYGLCIDIGINIQMALRRSVAPDYEPICSFEDSKIAQIGSSLIFEGTDAAWEKIRNEYYQSFFVNISGSANNQLNAWFDIQDNFEQQKNKEEQHIRLELLANDGFLGKRDCTGIEPEKRGINNEKCPILTPGATIADYLKKEYSNADDATLRATIKEDIAVLAGMVIDMKMQEFANKISNSPESLFKFESPIDLDF